MIAPADVVWRGDVGVTYADPEEVLEPGALTVAYPLYSVDSELSTESSNRQWTCRLLPCLPPLGLVAASVGLQLGAALLLLAAATNGMRLHGLLPNILDPELPSIYIYVLQRDPKTYAWCLAFVLVALLLIFTFAVAVAGAVAIYLGCCKWAKVLRALSIVQSLICLATTVTCGMWLCGYAVAQSAQRSPAVVAFMLPFNYGTLLFVKTHEHIIRAAGAMTAAATAASARAARATCHDTAAGAATTCFALLVSWAVTFLLVQGAIGGLAPPVFGAPAALLSVACLLCLNFGCLGRWQFAGLMGLFGAAALVAAVAWAAAKETYVVNYSNRPHKESSLLAQLKTLVNLAQWATALGHEVGVAGLVQMAAMQVFLCLYPATLMFARAFGPKINAYRRKRRQKKRDRELCEAVAHAAAHQPHAHAVIETCGTPVITTPVGPPPPPATLPLPPQCLPPQKILVPPPPHAVLP
ncbi:hypothetical protein, conserved [Eimeria tenella]|uniref:Uncharacterized protein n=1 Tax=Eimeria tenella TaxID=5802 RepID=U6KT17_EIMTE|nr:hypothetical protein, conserved [Eimeria tenella]CDJ39504.1 hypothetical protein, conserved [Eimeria tenella]|eukprot:XP_013230259.1 hypothetical protein, conserved [Eimeria tenella]